MSKVRWARHQKVSSMITHGQASLTDPDCVSRMWRVTQQGRRLGWVADGLHAHHPCIWMNVACIGGEKEIAQHGNPRTASSGYGQCIQCKIHVVRPINARVQRSYCPYIQYKYKPRKLYMKLDWRPMLDRTRAQSRGGAGGEAMRTRPFSPVSCTIGLFSRVRCSCLAEPQSFQHRRSFEYSHLFR